MTKQTVVRVDRSPMNPRVWSVQLQCGHDVWVSGRKPTNKTLHCERCAEKAKIGKP